MELPPPRHAISPITCRLCLLPDSLLHHARPARRPKAGGGGRIRTYVGARPTDLQSAPFSRSGTPPAEPEIMRLFRRLVNKIALPIAGTGKARAAWHYHGPNKGQILCESRSSKTIRTS